MEMEAMSKDARINITLVVVLLLSTLTYLLVLESSRKSDPPKISWSDKTWAVVIFTNGTKFGVILGFRHDGVLMWKEVTP